ncbi:MAG: lipid IV(A) 3-deoxy-D-manno-octulosonic acid transferase [Spongiibacteraceae bacterium]
MRWLYTLLLYLLSPLVLFRLFRRARKAPAYGERIAERFGFFSARLRRGGIWVHAVSVGETIAATPMIRALLERYPDLPITVTTMTPTGSEQVRALFAMEIHSGRIFHVYAPYDLPDAVLRFLNRIRPRMLIVVETELWPNIIHGCARRHIPVLLANARLSEKSARGYRRLAAITAPMLREMTRVVAQNAVDGERFVELGLPREKLSVTGSVKFDLTVDTVLQQRARDLRESFGRRPVWIAASTHTGEDEILLAAQRMVLQALPDALLILVPRHPERFAVVAGLIEKAELTAQRRSTNTVIARDTQVLLGDTMGELLLLLGVADIAFVGGSLIERGGHNMLEPAAWGLPIITGASDFNFREISEMLTAAGALQKCGTHESIANAVVELFDDPDERARQGDAARAVIEANRGALDKLIAEIRIVLQSVARLPGD